MSRSCNNKLSARLFLHAKFFVCNMLPKTIFKVTRAVIAFYAPLQNIGICVSILCCKDILAAFSSLPYIIAIDLDAILLWVLAKCFGFCRLYEIAILSPLLWTLLINVTPEEWNPYIALLALISSAVITILLIRKWFVTRSTNMELQQIN